MGQVINFPQSCGYTQNNVKNDAIMQAIAEMSTNLQMLKDLEETIPS